MAKFALGEKAEKEEAIESLKQHVSGVYDGVFDVKFKSDDGGSHITLYIEVEDTSEPLDPFISDAIWVPKWKGWRFIIMKCPPGYIDAILNAVNRDDW